MNQLEEIINSKKLSTRLLDKEINPSTRTNRLIEETLKKNSDIVEPLWVSRHAKFCYTHGIGAYMELIKKARKYGRNPKILLAYLINQEMNRGNKAQQVD